MNDKRATYEAKRKIRRQNDPEYRDKLRAQARARYYKFIQNPERKAELRKRQNTRSRTRWAVDSEYKQKRIQSHVNWYQKQDDDYHLTRRLRRYGVDIDLYKRLYTLQNEKCAICPYKFSSVYGRDVQADHDHDTGELRGLLCSDCNTSLGKFGDNLDGVMRVVNYLTRPPVRIL